MSLPARSQSLLSTPTELAATSQSCPTSFDSIFGALIAAFAMEHIDTMNTSGDDMPPLIPIAQRMRSHARHHHSRKRKLPRVTEPRERLTSECSCCLPSLFLSGRQ